MGGGHDYESKGNHRFQHPWLAMVVLKQLRKLGMKRMGGDRGEGGGEPEGLA